MDEIYEAIERADVLATKSRWLFFCHVLYCALGGYFILGDIWTFFTNVHNVEKILFMTVLMAVAGVLFLTVGIRGVSFYFNSPEGPVRADDKYVYLFRGEWWEYVAFEDITKVYTRGFGAGSVDGGDGALVIVTEAGKIKIVGLHNVGEAKILIGMKLIKPTD